MEEGVIIQKLKRFVQRYHSIQLFKGMLLVLLLSGLLFFLVGGVEYLFWLNSTGRLLLLVAFGLVFVFLIFRYVFNPLRSLFRLGREWDLEAAAKVIGQYFPEIEDRLLNYLQLHGDRGQSDLLDAALEQKAKSFEGIPFVKAIATEDLKKYALLLLIPLSLFLGVVLAGTWSDWSKSYTRVANYQLAYEPPAPFRFILENEELEIGSHESILLRVVTEGSLTPEQMKLRYLGQERLMLKEGEEFRIRLEQPLETGSLYFQAGRYRSRDYELTVRDIPSILDFEMLLNYPAYLNKGKEIISGSGNATVPEGTLVQWRVKTQNTEVLEWRGPKRVVEMNRSEGGFEHQESVYRDTDYEVSSSNSFFDDFEALNYSLKVIPDELPTIEAQRVVDTLAADELRIEGNASDDYGLKQLRIAAYAVRKPDSTFYKALPLSGELYSDFVVDFGAAFTNLESGGYRVYIEARDNDGNRNGKWARSREFDYRVRTAEQEEDQLQREREGLTDGLERSLEKLKKANAKVAEYQEGRKDAQNMRFSERDQLKSALEEQIQQEEMMKRFSQELRKNLENKEDARLLSERLKRQEQLAERNKRLLDELRKMAGELESEELKQELDETAKKQRSQQKSLEQLVELTKRFLVKEKLKELGKDFKELAEEQTRVANKQAQDSVQASFKTLSEELKNALDKNADLRKPYQ